MDDVFNTLVFVLVCYGILDFFSALLKTTLDSKFAIRVYKSEKVSNKNFIEPFPTKKRIF